MASDRTHVICFGNELHGDDGFGPAVFAELQTQPLPGYVRLYRADVAGLSALNCFADCDRALVVDAIRGFGAVGSVHRLTVNDVVAEESLSGHGAGVGSVLELLPSALPTLPCVDVLGAEVEDVSPFHMGLTPRVAAAIPEAIEHVLRWVSDG